MGRELRVTLRAMLTSRSLAMVDVAANGLLIAKVVSPMSSFLLEDTHIEFGCAHDGVNSAGRYNLCIGISQVTERIDG